MQSAVAVEDLMFPFISFHTVDIIIPSLFDQLFANEIELVKKKKKINDGDRVIEGNLSFGSSVSFSFIFNLQSED